MIKIGGFMKLLRFRVQSFRSIGDTNWVDIDDITAFIGTNESGKSNILMALWKLNPARDGEIVLVDDTPRKNYSKNYNNSEQPIFIEAEFEIHEPIINKLIDLTQAKVDEISKVQVSKRLDGKLSVNFPDFPKTITIPEQEITQLFQNYIDKLNSIKNLTKSELALREIIISSILKIEDNLKQSPSHLHIDDIQEIIESLKNIDTKNSPKNPKVIPLHSGLIENLTIMYQKIARPSPNLNDNACNLILDNMPKFIYYANYGNLDSAIYLPHVITNMERTDLSGNEAAKTRTLRVLFDYLKLKPQEILELGQDIGNRQNPPSENQIHLTGEQKRKRQILLQSASTELTEQFFNWWKQGNYKFDFSADGDHFRIWVSDEIRSEKIELEGRSAGLQWFLSFFLVFLVEQSGTHQNTILLLDEPGVSLHPIAQKDLFRFFETLSKKNQIIYTAHSPFMVDPDHLDRVRAVYFDESGKDKGLTKVSADLRTKEKQKSEQRSVYPIHAALELTVSSVLLVGCESVIVEGITDQYYLSAIKNHLIGKGVIAPEKEIIFLPSGSFKGIQSLIPIISGINENLPYIILDSDNPGKKMETQLKSNLYTGLDEKIIMIADICKIDGTEIEDLIPISIMKKPLSRYLRSISNIEEDIEDAIIENLPIVDQVESFAQNHNIELPVGWKVDIAKQVKEKLAKNPKSIKIESPYIEWWEDLFKRIIS